jgi:hypothetical protein
MLPVPSVWPSATQLLPVLCTAVRGQSENGAVGVTFPIGYSHTTMLYGTMRLVATRLSYRSKQPEETCGGHYSSKQISAACCGGRLWVM